jgi:hypothetical protein
MLDVALVGLKATESKVPGPGNEFCQLEYFFG